jgi:hypothetical protein
MFEKISCQANWAESGAVGQARLQNQNKRFLVILSNQVFSSEKVAFFRKKLLIPLRRISRRAFWLIWKNSQFFRSGVNKKKGSNYVPDCV